MSSSLRKLERVITEAQIRHLEQKERTVAALVARRQKKIAAEDGRLFRGKAPNKECAARRRELFVEWDQLREKWGRNTDTVRFIRFIRIELSKRPNESHPLLNFMRQVEEHNQYEREVTGEQN